MVKTATQLKKALGVSNGLRRKDESKSNKNTGKQQTSSQIKNSLKKGKYDFSQVKEYFEKKIGLETFSSDLSSMAKAIEDSTSGWQTQEQMQATKSSVENMRSRMVAYKEYVNFFGGDDEKTSQVLENIENMQKETRNVLDGWDELSNNYSKYSSADEYDNALKSSVEKWKEYEKMKSDDLGVVKNEITSLEETLKTAKAHESNVRGLHVKRNTWEHRSSGASTDRGYSDKVAEAENELNEYLKNAGFQSVKHLESVLDEKKSYYNKA